MDPVEKWQGKRARKTTPKQPSSPTPAIDKGPEPSPVRLAAVGRSDHPSTQDSLDRKVYVDAIGALIQNEKTQAPLTIGIYGAWGSGKSSFLAQLTERLHKRHHVINFNPWRLSTSSEVWANLVKEIAPVIDRQMGVIQRVRFLFSSNPTREVSKWHSRLSAETKKVGNWLAAATASGGVLAAGTLQNKQLPPSITAAIETVGLSDAVNSALAKLGTLPLGVVNWGGLAALTTVALVVAMTVFKAGRAMLRPFSTQFEANQAQFRSDSQALKDTTYKDFEALRKVIRDVTAWRAQRRKPHLVLLIDDLDRCPSDRVIGVLEAVNLFIAEMPIVTVFAIDTKFVSTAVAARHRFLFSKGATPEEKERYGRLFLEKIIHIPFQLPAVRSYERYIRALVAVSGGKEEASEQSQQRPAIPTASELAQGRRLRWPLAWYLSFLGSMMRNVDQAWGANIMLRLIFGLKLVDEQYRWLATQDDLTQIAVRKLEAKYAGKVNWSALFRFKTAVARARDDLLSVAITIEEGDRNILDAHIANLRGNPRSIKRFVNTYQLAKAIKDQGDLMSTDPISLADLAAWLVLLQNWPQIGSILSAQAKAEASIPERFFTDDWTKRLSMDDPKAPPDLLAFVQANRSELERLSSSARGLDIARCFSFFTPQA